MKLLMFAFIILISIGASAKTVRYELNITRGEVNLSGKKSVDWALMINGSIPAPTLEFTEGDDVEIILNNKLKEEVSMHWHGLLVPPDQDGVAYVNMPPIHGGTSRTFRFKLRQHGTYWYHSHTGLQEQKGVYGAFIVHPKEKKIKYDRDLIVVMSDWSDENPDQILKNLRKDGDYYLYKKNSVRSYFGAIQAKSLGAHLGNEWSRMGGMDLSDVGYDAFLLNGKRSSLLSDARPGEKIRIRLINAAASTYFYISLGQQAMNVISADGTDITPTLAKELLMGMAETYDVLYEVPQNKSVELRATSQDVTGYASGWIGSGEKEAATDKPYPNLYAAMEHSSHESHGVTEEHGEHSEHSEHSGHGEHAGHQPTVETLTVDEIKSSSPTSFPSSIPRYDLKLVLGGDMERYVWHINGKTMNQDRTLEIKEGDVVRFTFVNETMMHHPMHLHGHFFRVLTKNGEHSPLKHTVDVPPHESRTIEFLANEPGEWMLHCHNLYHMKTGMARVVKYSTFTPDPELAAIQKKDHHLHNHPYATGFVELSTNHAQAELRLLRNWDALELRYETENYLDLHSAESDIFYRRWFTNYFSVLGGAEHFNKFDKHETRAVVGVGYVLPMLIESQIFVDQEGKFRLDLEKRFQWTSRIFSEAEVSFREQAKAEFELSLMYGSNWNWSAGFKFTDDDIGVGVQYNF